MQPDLPDNSLRPPRLRGSTRIRSEARIWPKLIPKPLTPERVGKFGIAHGDVACGALIEAKPSEEPKTGCKPLFLCCLSSLRVANTGGFGRISSTDPLGRCVFVML